MADKDKVDANGAEEKMETEEKETSDSDDSSSDEDLETEGKNAARISELEASVTENPYAYDSHIELTKLLREDGELVKARESRENMSKIFPLTGELWLDWIQDEMKFEEDREKIIDLFDRAVQDYLSIDVWLEYCQYSIGGLGTPEGLKQIRDTFERAVTAGGLHVTKGANLWEVYREFENALLAGMQPQPGAVSTKEQEEKTQAQMNRVSSLFKRQLSLPLMDMEATWAEYNEWMTDIDPNIKNTYEKAKEKLVKIQQLEGALDTSEAPHYNGYIAYIDYELKQKEPARIQCLFERALAEGTNCLVPDLWEKYTKYLDEVLMIRRVCIDVHRRAVRNCTASCKLWVRYLLSLERFDYTHEEILEVFDKAFKAGFASGEDYLLLWTTKCDYMRRQIEWDREHEKQVEDLRKTFDAALEFLDYHFPGVGDPTCSLKQYWARFEAKFGKNIDKTRELWNDIMTQGFGNQAQMWLDYYNLERSFGDHKHCRKVLQRAVNSVTDRTDEICTTFLNYEREEGTLEQYDQAVTKCSAQLKRAQERLDKAAEKETRLEEQKQKQRQEKRANKKTEKPQGKSIQQSLQKLASAPENTEFKVPRAPPSAAKTGGSRPPPPGFKPKPGSSGPPPGFKPRSEGVRPPPGFKAKATEEPEGDGGPDPKRARVEEEGGDATEAGRQKASGGKENQTVFVSNLDFSVTEETITYLFSKVGEINEVRLIKNFKGKSKGYAYVEFKDEFPVEAALKLDREAVEGRPMFVSKCESKSGGAGPGQKQFRYATDVERNKLFIKNLPFSATKETIAKLFSEHGALKDVRLVTYRSGAPKGLAYVEFENESHAQQAVLKCDGFMMGDHEIAVAISNPPQRKAPVTQRDGLTPTLGSGKKDFGSRKAHTQLSLMPRSVHRAPPPGRSRPPGANSNIGGAAGDQQADKSDKPQGKMSNADFRSMLLNK